MKNWMSLNYIIFLTIDISVFLKKNFLMIFFCLVFLSISYGQIGVFQVIWTSQSEVTITGVEPYCSTGVTYCSTGSGVGLANCYVDISDGVLVGGCSHTGTKALQSTFFTFMKDVQFYVGTFHFNDILVIETFWLDVVRGTLAYSSDSSGDDFYLPSSETSLTSAVYCEAPSANGGTGALSAVGYSFIPSTNAFNFTWEVM